MVNKLPLVDWWMSRVVYYNSSTPVVASSSYYCCCDTPSCTTLVHKMVKTGFSKNTSGHLSGIWRAFKKAATTGRDPTYSLQLLLLSYGHRLYTSRYLASVLHQLPAPCIRATLYSTTLQRDGDRAMNMKYKTARYRTK